MRLHLKKKMMIKPNVEAMTSFVLSWESISLLNRTLRKWSNMLNNIAG